MLLWMKCQIHSHVAVLPAIIRYWTVHNMWQLKCILICIDEMTGALWSVHIAYCLRISMNTHHVYNRTLATSSLTFLYTKYEAKREKKKKNNFFKKKKCKPSKTVRTLKSRWEKSTTDLTAPKTKGTIWIYRGVTVGRWFQCLKQCFSQNYVKQP